MAFKQAVRGQIKIHIAFTGPSGSGKTEAALRLATAIAANEARKRNKPGSEKIALADTEGGSSVRYADRFRFDVDPMERKRHDPRAFSDVVRAAIADGYDVLILDSISHEWRATSAMGASDGWAIARPIHESFMDLATKTPAIHVICTMREAEHFDFSKKKTQAGGEKMSVTKLGLAPIGDAEAAYEFDSMLKLSTRHTVTVDKTRCQALALGRNFDQVGPEIAGILIRWADYGDVGDKPLEAAKPAPAPAEGPEKAAPDAAATIATLYREIGALAKQAMELAPDCAEAWTAKVGDRKATYAQVEKSRFPDPLAQMLVKATAFVAELRAPKPATPAAGMVPAVAPAPAPTEMERLESEDDDEPPPVKRDREIPDAELTKQHLWDAMASSGWPVEKHVDFLFGLSGSRQFSATFDKLRLWITQAKLTPYTPENALRFAPSEAPAAPRVEEPKALTQKDFWRAAKAAGWPKDDQRQLCEYVTGLDAEGPQKMDPAKIPGWIERVKSLPYDAAAVALVRAGAESARLAKNGQATS